MEMVLYSTEGAEPAAALVDVGRQHVDRAQASVDEVDDVAPVRQRVRRADRHAVEPAAHVRRDARQVASLPRSKRRVGNGS